MTKEESNIYVQRCSVYITKANVPSCIFMLYQWLSARGKATDLRGHAFSATSLKTSEWVGSRVGELRPLEVFLSGVS